MIMQHGASIAMINHLAVDNLKHEYDTRVIGDSWVGMEN
jgi:hypothetical protein